MSPLKLLSLAPIFILGGLSLVSGDPKDGAAVPAGNPQLRGIRHNTEIKNDGWGATWGTQGGLGAGWGDFGGFGTGVAQGDQGALSGRALAAGGASAGVQRGLGQGAGWGDFGGFGTPSAGAGTGSLGGRAAEAGGALGRGAGQRGAAAGAAPNGDGLSGFGGFDSNWGNQVGFGAAKPGAKPAGQTAAATGFGAGFSQGFGNWLGDIWGNQNLQGASANQGAAARGASLGGLGPVNPRPQPSKPSPHRPRIQNPQLPRRQVPAVPRATGQLYPSVRESSVGRGSRWQGHARTTGRRHQFRPENAVFGDQFQEGNNLLRRRSAWDVIRPELMAWAEKYRQWDPSGVVRSVQTGDEQRAYRREPTWDHRDHQQPADHTGTQLGHHVRQPQPQPASWQDQHDGTQWQGGARGQGHLDATGHQGSLEHPAAEPAQPARAHGNLPQSTQGFPAGFQNQGWSQPRNQPAVGGEAWGQGGLDWQSQHQGWNQGWGN